MDPKIRQYMMQKYFAGQQPDVLDGADQTVADAQNQQQNAQYAGIAAQVGDSLANANRQPVALDNRMQDLGKAPATIQQQQQKTDVSGVQRMADSNLQTARGDRDQALQMMLQQRKEELAQQLQAKRDAEAGVWKQKEFDQRERGLKAQNASREAYAANALGLKKEQLGLEREKLAAQKDKPTADQTRNAATQKEVDYRVNSINSALDRLEKNVKDNGTFEMFGTASSDMDSDLYNMALDYAKLVDPQSVAREGEVAAAQKYMLPIKGMNVRNDTALGLIKRMKEQVAKRAQDMGVAPTTSTGGGVGRPAAARDTGGVVSRDYETMSDEELEALLKGQ